MLLKFRIAANLEEVWGGKKAFGGVNHLPFL